MRVRAGKISDIPQILVLGKELLEQSPAYAGIEMNEVKYKRTVAMVMTSKIGAVFVIADDDDVAQGFIFGIADEFFFSDGRYVTDMAVYAREAAKSHSGFMIRRFIKWAKTVAGVKLVPMAISSGDNDIEQTGKLYEALGGKRVGGLYIF